MILQRKPPIRMGIDEGNGVLPVGFIGSRIATIERLQQEMPEFPVRISTDVAARLRPNELQLIAAFLDNV